MNVNEMRGKTCCFTGHREIPQQNQKIVSKNLEKTVADLIGKGYLYFGAGGAYGFDSLAAQTVLKLKKKHRNIKLILVLPCLSQTKRWSTEAVEEYERIKAQADKVVYTSQEYTKDCFHKRNRHLVDYSSVCVCYLTKDGGGTDYTVGYARLKGLDVINLAPGRKV